MSNYSKSLYFILLIIFFFSLLIFINITRAEGIIFSEIMYDPVGSDSGNEWIELLNKTTSSISIGSDWRLSDSSNHLINFYNGPTSVWPGSFFVITQNASNFLNNYPNYTSLYRPLYESSFSLNNASGTIKLFQGSNLITEQGYTSVIGGNGNGKALERVTPQFNDNVWTEGWVIGGTPGSLSNTPPTLYAPIPIIKVSTTTIYVGNSLLFDASSSTDQNGDTLNYLWNIGNIASSTDQIFTYCFLNSGTYNVSLTVSDATSSNTANVTINVLENDIEIPLINYTGKIILNELLPNPEGDDDGEWIELKNISSDDIDLTDFLIQDESGRDYLISPDDFSTTTIKAGEFFAIDYTISRIILNNTGDKVTIFDNNENKISEISYSSVKEGQSFARFTNSWNWTTSPTKGLENVLTESTQESSSVTIINNTTNNTSDITKQDDIICDLNSLNKSIVISEIFPNPVGDDTKEFIEIYNPNDYDINISNWKIKDLSSSFFKLTGLIKSKSYFLISREDSKLALNNSKEEIFIYDCKDVLITNLKYDKSYENQSYSYNLLNKEYFWTKNTTPGEENIFDIKEDVDSKEIATSTIIEELYKDEEEAMQEYSSVFFNELSQNETVIGYGAIVLTQNKISNNSAYICNYKLQEKIVDYYDCINLYFNGKWPAIKRGSIIKFSGKFSQSASSKKIKISKKENIEVVDSVKLLSPDEILISNIDEGLLGSFISIKGKISKLNQKSFNIKLDEEEFKIKIVTKDIDLKSFIKEENVFVSGIVLKEKDSFILALGNKSDLIKDLQVEENIDILGEKIESKETINLVEDKESFFIKIVSNIGKFFGSIRSSFVNKLFASK